MRNGSADQEGNIALLIDADNAPASRIDVILAELAKLGEQAATEAGFVPNTRAEPPSEAPRPESPPPPDPAAVALDLPLAVLNKPEVLQQLQAKFGPDFMRKARLADFVKLAQETPGHAG